MDLVSTSTVSTIAEHTGLVKRLISSRKGSALSLEFLESEGPNALAELHRVQRDPVLSVRYYSNGTRCDSALGKRGRILDELFLEVDANDRWVLKLKFRGLRESIATDDSFILTYEDTSLNVSVWVDGTTRVPQLLPLGEIFSNAQKIIPAVGSLLLGETTLTRSLGQLVSTIQRDSLPTYQMWSFWSGEPGVSHTQRILNGIENKYVRLIVQKLLSSQAVINFFNGLFAVQTDLGAPTSFLSPATGLVTVVFVIGVGSAVQFPRSRLPRLLVTAAEYTFYGFFALLVSLGFMGGTIGVAGTALSAVSGLGIRGAVRQLALSDAQTRSAITVMVVATISIATQARLFLALDAAITNQLWRGASGTIGTIGAVAGSPSGEEKIDSALGTDGTIDSTPGAPFAPEDVRVHFLTTPFEGEGVAILRGRDTRTPERLFDECDFLLLPSQTSNGSTPTTPSSAAASSTSLLTTS